MKSLAVIPARSGSKRIPNKNIFPSLGKPAISYTIESTIASGLFDEVYVSTDSMEFANIARKCGAMVTNLRSAKLSNDYTTTIEVIKDFINTIPEPHTNPDSICCVYPVTPLLETRRLKQGLDMLEKFPQSFIFAGLPFESNPSRYFTIDSDSRAIFEYSALLNKRTQDFQLQYKDAGQFYWGSTRTWLARSSILAGECHAVILEKYETFDVDEIEDMQIVEILMRDRMN